MAEKKSKSAAATVADGVDKDLNDALTKIEKNYGKGAIMRLGDKANVDVGVIPTGSLLIDHALGVGGYPKGRVIEIFGPESSGKTTLALHAIAEVQKMGGRAAFIDAENAIDPEYAAALGVNIDDLLLSQPDNGEQALEICELLAGSKAIDLIVIDSVAALVPKAEIDQSMDQATVGTQARLMSKALRRLTGILNRTETTVIFINQLRANVNAVGYGPTETTSGGRALKFYASIRIDIRRTQTLKDNATEEASGNLVHVKIVKNKVAPPFKQVYLTMVYGHGLDRTEELIDCAIANNYNIIKKSGSWFSYGTEKIGQGRALVRQYLLDHPDVAAEVEAKIKENLANGLTPEQKKTRD